MSQYQGLEEAAGKEKGDGTFSCPFQGWSRKTGHYGFRKRLCGGKKICHMTAGPASSRRWSRLTHAHQGGDSENVARGRWIGQKGRRGHLRFCAGEALMKLDRKQMNSYVFGGLFFLAVLLFYLVVIPVLFRAGAS